MDLSCPVCMESIDENGDNALLCVNGHRTCLTCAGKMVRPCAGCKPDSCTGLWFTCPLCKTRSTLHPPFILAILQGRWARSHQLHSSDEHVQQWIALCSSLAHGKA